MIISTLQIIKTFLENDHFKTVIISNFWQQPSISAKLSLKDMNFPYKVLKSVCIELYFNVDAVLVIFNKSLRWNMFYVKKLVHTFIFSNI